MAANRRRLRRLTGSTLSPEHGVHLTTTAPLTASVEFEHPETVEIVRQRFMRGRPKDGQIVGRATYSAGTKDGDVRVSVRVESKVVLQEPSVGLRGPILNALDGLLDFTTIVIASLATFDKTVY